MLKILKTFFVAIFLGAAVYFLLYNFTMKARNRTVQIIHQGILGNSRKVHSDKLRILRDALNVEDSLRDTKANSSWLSKDVQPTWIVGNSTNTLNLKKTLSTAVRFFPTTWITTVGNSERSETPVKKTVSHDVATVTSSTQIQDANVRVLATVTATTSGSREALTLRGLMIQLDSYLQETKLSKDEPCPSFTKVGRVPIQEDNVTLSQLESELHFVEKGGRWKPSQCKAKRKVAIVIPFRDRQEHLNIFLRHMHLFLRLQQLDYRVFVVEQAGEEKFNRGVLMNIGFVEARKVFDFTCVVFHDVDLIPEDTGNEYSCPTSPRHMSPAVSSLNYKLLYAELFGGVEGFWKEHFVQINGFPNRYWGWGGEDDDLYQRIRRRGFRLTRPSNLIGRYTMLSHGHEEGFQNPERFYELRNFFRHVDTDGLNTLSYNLLSTDEFPLYTLLTVQPLRS